MSQSTCAVLLSPDVIQSFVEETHVVREFVRTSGTKTISLGFIIVALSRCTLTKLTLAMLSMRISMEISSSFKNDNTTVGLYGLNFRMHII